jgi:hypothetical protein
MFNLLVPIFLLTTFIAGASPTLLHAEEPLYRLRATGHAGALGGERDYVYTIAAQQSGNDVRLVYREVDPRANGIQPGALLFVGTRQGDVAEGTVHAHVPHQVSLLLARGNCSPLTVPGTLRFENGDRRLQLYFSVPQREHFTCQPSGRLLKSHGTLEQINAPPLPTPPAPIAIAQPTPPARPPAAPMPPPIEASNPFLLPLFTFLAFVVGLVGAAAWFAIATRPPPIPDPLVPPQTPPPGARPTRISEILPQYPGSMLDVLRGGTGNLRARGRFKQASRDLLVATADETKALGQVLHERGKVAAQLAEFGLAGPVLAHPSAHADVSTVTLGLTEIGETLRIGLPELSPELRSRIIALLREAMEAKLT